MSSTAGSSVPAGEQPCPDPSAHFHQNKLSEQASSAALYVTHPERNLDVRESERINPLGPDGKMSSKGAAASLKYAKAQDLPSFPSRGTTADSASKAALLAKDYKMKELWQPEMSNAASRASLIAARDGGKLDLWQASPSAAGNSAATLAMRNNGLSPEIDRGYTADGRSRALQAAALSHSQSQRSRTEPTSSAPAKSTYPDSHNSAANALNAATVSHRNSKLAPDGWDSEANQAARIKNLGGHMDPKMFGGKPPVEIEEEEKRHNAALRASAISMAKQMYDLQQNTATPSADLTGGREGAETAHARQAPSASTDIKEEAMRYIHLQDAAHKLAQERLAKVDKSFENARYREYYGYPDDSSRKSLNRLSLRNRNRNRASSGATEDSDDSDDEERARRIRGQMSQLTSGLSNVDEKKRSDDRAKLLAAAEKRVHAQMHDMDERVFMDTGKVTPAMMEEWEAKARQRVQEEKELQSANRGKTHIGGGKFIDQAELEAIAQARLKPTLDEINDTAEKKRAHDEEVRLEKEEQERAKREEKRQHKEEKEEQKRVKNEEKAVARKEKEEERARKEEEKRIAKEDKRKSREQKRESAFIAESTAAGGIAAEDDEDAPAGGKGERKSGIFGRLSTKLKRRSNKVDDQADTEATPMTEKTTETALEDDHDDSAVVAGGLVAGGVGAAALTEHEHAVSEKAQPSEAIALPDDESEVKPLETAPTAISATTFGHTGNYTDALPSPAVERSRPDLERHISTIDTSDEEEGEEKTAGSLSRPAEVVAAEAVAAPVVIPEEADDDRYSATPKATSVVEASQPQPLLAHVSQEPIHGEPSMDPVSPIETALGPDRVIPQPLTTETTSTAPEPAAHEAGADGDVSPIVEDAPVDASITKTDTGPAPHTIGPHSSDLANILDPRVKPDPEKMTGRKTSGPHDSDMANILDPRVEAYPDKGESGTEKKKGLRGFLGKLKNRQSRSENKLTKAAPEGAVASTEKSAVTTVPAEDTTAPTGTAVAASKDLNVNTDTAAGVPVVVEDTSPSSFRRHADDLRNPDDASSSGVDEDDLGRGRAGGTSRPLDKGKVGAATEINKTSSSNDEEQFEEARDHFDETLAPPPAFGGQAKSGSPVRGTKFQEVGL